jgi:hypothetical protein
MITEEPELGTRYTKELNWIQYPGYKKVCHPGNICQEKNKIF